MRRLHLIRLIWIYTFWYDIAYVNLVRIFLFLRFLVSLKYAMCELGILRTNVYMRTVDKGPRIVVENYGALSRLNMWTNCVSYYWIKPYSKPLERNIINIPMTTSSHVTLITSN